jgi:hypothetical protein
MRTVTRPSTTVAVTTAIACGDGLVLDVTGRGCIPAQNTSFASLLSVVMPTEIIAVTKSDLAALVKSVANQSGCEAQLGCDAVVLSITDTDGVTVVCTNGICPGYNDARRRLLGTGRFQIIFGMVAKEPLKQNITFQLYFPDTQSVLDSIYVDPVKVDNSLLSKVEDLIVYVNAGGKFPVAPTSVPLVSGVVAGCILVVVVIVVLATRKRKPKSVFSTSQGAEFTMTSEYIPIRIVIAEDMCHVKAT